MAQRAAFDDMSRKSATDVAASAERWRNGLAALTTVITAGLLIKGPANAADLTFWWRVGLTTLFGAGILASIAGTWLALRAAAGVPTSMTFSDLVRRYGAVDLYRLLLADKAAQSLRRARICAVIALVLLGVGVLAWWWAPAATSALVQVDHAGGQACGTIVSSDNTGLRLATRDNTARTTIAWSTITSIKPVKNCME